MIKNFAKCTYSARDQVHNTCYVIEASQRKLNVYSYIHGK